MTDDGEEEPSSDEDAGVELHWIAPEDNPFGILLLDVRPLTQTYTSWTADPEILEKYGAQRENDGVTFIVSPILGSEVVACGLSFDLPRPEDEGPVFKATCMEDKWDIYHYAGYLLFARSWTGELVFRALLKADADNLVITAIESRGDYAEHAPQHVAFLVISHFEGLPFPHTLPSSIPADPAEMALASFSFFGRWARFATHEDILAIKINPNFDSGDSDTST